jgi:glycosyltransferase involved in cell wall biosynthesis
VGVKVSVVVPVWNPGKYIDRCVDSLLAQTMPPADFEVLFMDDGSTDGTERRLDAWAAAYEQFRVHHLPNSGWPGKPRNEGIDRAVGEYVFFMDNDDVMGVQSLERMYAIAARNDSDIVLGKVVSDWRGVPHHVFKQTRERCTVRDAPLFDSLTPHKMFRRQFLLEHGIRYPEGKRRLEDQLIMARAYFPARSVSIVGDYVCYYYLRRADGSNAGSARIDPPGYYANLREVLDVVEANTEPGELRDSIHRRFYRGEMLGRVGGAAVLNYHPAFRERVFAEVRALALDARFSPGVHAGLAPLTRVQSYFVRENRLEDLLSYTERVTDIRGNARLEGLEWRSGSLVLGVRAWLEYAGKPLELDKRDGRLLLPAELTLAAPTEQRDCSDQFAAARIDATVRNRDTFDEFFAPTEMRPTQAQSADKVRAEWVGEIRLDPGTLLEGAPLPRGVWDLYLRLSALGITRAMRFGRNRAAAADRGVRPALVGHDTGIAVAIPYWTTPHGNLSLDIDQFAQSLKTAVRPGKAGLLPFGAGTRPVVRLTLPVTSFVDRSVAGVMRFIERETGAEVTSELELTGEGDKIRLAAALPRRADGLSAGRWDIAVQIPELGWPQAVRMDHVLRVPEHGTPRLTLDPRLRRLRRYRLAVRQGARDFARLVREARAL